MTKVKRCALSWDLIEVVKQPDMSYGLPRIVKKMFGRYIKGFLQKLDVENIKWSAFSKRDWNLTQKFEYIFFICWRQNLWEI